MMHIRITLLLLALGLFASRANAQGQDFEIGYGLGLNFSQLRVVDSTAGLVDTVNGTTFEVAPVQSAGWSFEFHTIWHATKHLDIRTSLGADWINGKISIGRKGVGGTTTRTEDQYFEGWFHFSAGPQFQYEIFPQLLGFSAGVDVVFGLAAINLVSELPKSDTITVTRDYYRLTSVNTFDNGLNIFVRPHAQFNFFRKSGRKWTISLQYDQGLFPYYNGRSSQLTFIDPFTREPIMESGYYVEGRGSRLTLMLGAEIPLGRDYKPKPIYRRF